MSDRFVASPPPCSGWKDACGARPTMTPPLITEPHGG
jgi:hypothetical protein